MTKKTKLFPYEVALIASLVSQMNGKAAYENNLT